MARKRKKIFAITLLLTASVSLYAERLPGWMLPLRDAVFEQSLSANEIRSIYLTAVAETRRQTTGAAQNLALSRAEHLMGQALLFEERGSEAGTHFAEGLRLAELAVQASPSADAWVMRAENLAHLIQTRNWTFATRNGLDVERFARNALELDSRNAPAQYLIAARWVFAPRPFNNFRRGIEMMEAILQNADLDRDDVFNVTSAIGWAHIEQRNFDQARPWIERALEVYPTNQFATDLLATIDNRGRRR